MFMVDGYVAVKGKYFNYSWGVFIWPGTLPLAGVVL